MKKGSFFFISAFHGRRQINVGSINQSTNHIKLLQSNKEKLRESGNIF